ncbi:hypothetical protein H0H81_004762 [Sphagnurus paluster]|uniref:Protein kinase domain-containing protein n=1 Tax=Sphagnurus paluster TaxID=117069 RepID=A0A9P7FUB5_9AGAR|nr:hypothetical protein H0H81_004762 [Sphagnurus paluster]
MVATQRLSTDSGLYPVCYELENLSMQGGPPIASGGFADIYKGYFKGQTVCLKAVRVYEKDAIKYVLKQFSKEAILWGQLSHPNVLPIYGLFHFENKVCIVAPWMDYGDLRKYLNNNPTANRLRLANDVLEGLSYLHNNGIIHGDLKGPNVLINNAGRAYLADFGISSGMDAKILAWTSHSSMSSKGGSVRWQAPELIDPEVDDLIRNTTASDIFTGEIPFPTYPDPRVTLRVMMGERPARPEKSSIAWSSWGLTEKVWLLMEECWVKNPDERPTTQQLSQRLIPWLTDDTRSTASGNFLPPASFRAKMGPPKKDLVSVSELENMLCQDAYPGSIMVHKGHNSSSFPGAASRARLPPSPFNDDDADKYNPYSSKNRTWIPPRGWEHAEHAWF